jgi:dihydroorotate dehydrogenase electron transfer subunit
MIQTKARILSRKKVAKDIFKISFFAPEICRTAQPGQFINIRLTEMRDPLLRRPFSIHRVNGDILEILLRVVGRGTDFLTKLPRSTTLDILGPLGHGFTISDRSTAVLIAGGMGTAPLVLLSQELVRKGKKVFFLIGAEKKSLLLCEKECQSLGAEVFVSTDNGSYGFKGFVTALLVSLLDEGKIPRDAQYYACGPDPMFHALAPIVKARGLSCQVSLEEKMACGIGTCLSCVCKVEPEIAIARRGLKESHIQTSPGFPYGYALVCSDGPVFDVEEVVWED